MDDELQAKLAKLGRTISQANADKAAATESQRKRTRRVLAEKSFETLAFLDAVRQRFGPGVRLVKLKCEGIDE